MSLTDYRTLGRSGLVVSPLALGTMTFGIARWGTAEADSEAIFNAYIDAGGNFVDTANVYAAGQSETLLGNFIARRQLRHQVVLATKSGFHCGPAGHVHGGGNGRKHMLAALDASLARLGTDHVDLYWLHAWDRVTPVEEVLQTFGDLIRAGKIRYFGLSNVPAWYAAKAAALASAHGVPGPVALQLEYSLAERHIEREHLPAARDAGMGLTAWSPLAAGFLSGKYAPGDKKSGGRLHGPNPFGDQKFTETNWRTLAALKSLASELGCSPAQLALAWLCAQPGVTAPILGVSNLAQLQGNLQALYLRLDAAQLALLGEASAAPLCNPYNIFSDEVNLMLFGGVAVARQ